MGPQPKPAHGPCGFCVNQIEEFSPYSCAVSVHTAESIFHCSSLLPGSSACTLELYCRYCVWAFIEVLICMCVALLVWPAHHRQWLAVPVCHRYNSSYWSRESCTSLKMEVASRAYTAVLGFQGQKLQFCPSIPPGHLLCFTEHIG